MKEERTDVTMNTNNSKEVQQQGQQEGSGAASSNQLQLSCLNTSCYKKENIGFTVNTQEEEK